MRVGFPDILTVQLLQGAGLPATIQFFVQALGLLVKGPCAYCHVEDRSSDAKLQKVIARRIIVTAQSVEFHDAEG